MRHDQRPRPNCSITWAVWIATMVSTKYSICSSDMSLTKSSPQGKGGASKAKTSTPDETNPQPEPGVALPFGPRGVSLATIQKPGHQNHLLENGLVSEVIAALIRAIGPVSKPVLDGDGRNLDAEDASPNELSADDVAQSQEVDLDRPDVDWPRLVIACRKRIGVMINRLKISWGSLFLDQSGLPGSSIEFCWCSACCSGSELCRQRRVSRWMAIGGLPASWASTNCVKHSRSRCKECTGGWNCTLAGNFPRSSCVGRPSDA